MRYLAIIAACVFALASRLATSAEDLPHKPEALSLWDGKAPNGDGSSEEVDVRLTLHRPAKPNGIAIVICPGGGYGGLVTGGEGHGIAKWLNGHGITGLVLEYRLPKGRPYVPLLDAQRAIRTARANAEKWNLDA
ncbi:MAG: alpha/beta hydrolase, partial [Planctomycetota bacterium]|nr:alpha/beta hydrolase [Planctomycetota bacterium]